MELISIRPAIRTRIRGSAAIPIDGDDAAIDKTPNESLDLPRLHARVPRQRCDADPAATWAFVVGEADEDDLLARRKAREVQRCLHCLDAHKRAFTETPICDGDQRELVGTSLAGAAACKERTERGRGQLVGHKRRNETQNILPNRENVDPAFAVVGESLVVRSRAGRCASGHRLWAGTSGWAARDDARLLGIEEAPQRREFTRKFGPFRAEIRRGRCRTFNICGGVGHGGSAEVPEVIDPISSDFEPSTPGRFDHVGAVKAGEIMPVVGLKFVASAFGIGHELANKQWCIITQTRFPPGVFERVGPFSSGPTFSRRGFHAASPVATSCSVAQRLTASMSYRRCLPILMNGGPIRLYDHWSRVAIGTPRNSDTSVELARGIVMTRIVRAIDSALQSLYVYSHVRARETRVRFAEESVGVEIRSSGSSSR